MYKVLKERKDAWHVVWVASPDAEPVLIPHLDSEGRQIPYAHRQAAYRRAKKLNDAAAKVDAMIARDGAIIL